MVVGFGLGSRCFVIPEVLIFSRGILRFGEHLLVDSIKQGRRGTAAAAAATTTTIIVISLFRMIHSTQ